MHPAGHSRVQAVQPRAASSWMHHRGSCRDARSAVLSTQHNCTANCKATPAGEITPGLHGHERGELHAPAPRSAWVKHSKRNSRPRDGRQRPANVCLLTARMPSVAALLCFRQPSRPRKRAKGERESDLARRGAPRSAAVRQVSSRNALPTTPPAAHRGNVAWVCGGREELQRWVRACPGSWAAASRIGHGAFRTLR